MNRTSSVFMLEWKKKQFWDPWKIFYKIFFPFSFLFSIENEKKMNPPPFAPHFPSILEGF